MICSLFYKYGYRPGIGEINENKVPCFIVDYFDGNAGMGVRASGSTSSIVCRRVFFGNDGALGTVSLSGGGCKMRGFHLVFKAIVTLV